MTKNILFLTSGTMNALRANENKNLLLTTYRMLAQSRETALGRQESSF